MNYSLPAKVKADINRIAALQTDNEKLQVLIDRILIGYTYFLPPQQYMDLWRADSKDWCFTRLVFSNPSDRYFQSTRPRADVHFMPIHPLINKMLEKYEGFLPGVSHKLIAPLYKHLFPDAPLSGKEFFSVRMQDYSIPRKVCMKDEITRIEGLSWPQLYMLRGFEGPKVGPAIDKMFDQPFFDHLKIRVNTNKQ